MIRHFFPSRFQRYLSLPVRGSSMEAYATWLHDHHYTWRSGRYELRMAAQVCAYLKRRSVLRIEDVQQEHLDSCHRLFRRNFTDEAGSVRVLARFLMESGLVKRSASPETTTTQIQVNVFAAHLREHRGYAPSTIQRHVSIVLEFLNWLHFAKAPQKLSSVNVNDIEGFLQRLSKRMGRVGLQKPIAILRNFLRFLAANGVIGPGLDKQIDRPRIYRQEQLPRALPWATVQQLLRSIDRHQAIGKRDYAMILLMASYGLRACDVVALKLEDILWRNGYLRIRQSKTGNLLELPLTGPVSSAICDYLTKVPRHRGYRQVFLRLRAPSGPLKSTAVIEAFQAWSQKSGLDIPFKGVHCIRHSYAIHLLRRGVSLKSIGDLLGHRSPESTAVYLRLATEDLRTVALPVPPPIAVSKQRRG